MSATFATRAAAAADARDQARLAAGSGWEIFRTTLPSCIRLRCEHYEAPHTVLVNYYQLAHGWERTSQVLIWDDDATTAQHLHPAESTALVDLLVVDLDHDQLTQLCGRAAA